MAPFCSNVAPFCSYGVAYAQGQEAQFTDDACKLGSRVAGLVKRLSAA